MKKLYITLFAFILIAGIIVVAMPKAQADSEELCNSYCYNEILEECVAPDLTGHCPSGYECADPQGGGTGGPGWLCKGTVNP